MEVSALLQILLMQVTTLCIAFTFLLINISAVYAKARIHKARHGFSFGFIFVQKFTLDTYQKDIFANKKRKLGLECELNQITEKIALALAKLFYTVRTLQSRWQSTEMVW